MRALPGRGLRPLGPRRGWYRRTTWRSGADERAPRALLPPGTQTQRRSPCRPSTSGSEAAVLAQAQRPPRGAWSCDITEVRSALLPNPLWSLVVGHSLPSACLFLASVLQWSARHRGTWETEEGLEPFPAASPSDRLQHCVRNSSK